ADLDRLNTILSEYPCGEAWLLTSPLMLPAARWMLRQYCAGVLDRVRLLTTRNEYLGGNIQVMDMCTIGDLAAVIEETLVGAPAPAVIVIPGSGFNSNGRDLMGRHWRDLERWFGIPVRLLTA